MSSIDIYTVLEKFKADWDHIDSAVQVIEAITEHLREAEKSGYLGTLYRTDFEVEGVGEFPVDMLRYTSAWPQGESDTSAIADSFDGGGRRKIMLSKYHRDPTPNLAADRWEAKFRWRLLRSETVQI